MSSDARYKHMPAINDPGSCGSGVEGNARMRRALDEWRPVALPHYMVYDEEDTARR